MSYFAVLARECWEDKCIPLAQVQGGENKAINLAQQIHKNGGMNRTMVIDEQFSVIFKIDRRCKCASCQWDIDGTLRCMNCKRIVPVGKFKVEAYQ